MLKEKAKTFHQLLVMVHLTLSVGTFALAYAMRKHLFEAPLLESTEYLVVGVLVIPIWFVFLKVLDISKFQRTQPFSWVLLDHLKLVAGATMTLFFFIFLLKLDDVSRILLAIFAGLNLLVLFGASLGIYAFFKSLRAKGFNTRNVLLLADRHAVPFIEKLRAETVWGYIIKGIITDDPVLLEPYGHLYTLYSPLYPVGQILDSQAIDELIMDSQGYTEPAIQRLVFTCQEVGVVFRYRSELFNMAASKAHISHFGEHPFLTFKNTPSDHIAMKTKMLVDYLLAGLILLLASPLLLGIAGAIKLSSPGPVIFRQTRVGLRGRQFEVFKFRTMVVNAEQLKPQLVGANEMDGPVFKMKDDPRVTPIGRFLRKTSLDEFPQFLNVLRGEMSIIGPRPPLPQEVQQYERWQLRRLSMKPGISCIWQVSGRNDTTFEEWMRLDLQYIDTWSLKLDFVLILKTIKAILLGSGR